MGAVRKLNNVLRELESLAEQGKVEGFFNNVENADKLGGIVEDIREAVMDYQVRGIQEELTSSRLISISDAVTTRYLPQELPTHCERCFPIV
jgi:hypothetical protein